MTWFLFTAAVLPALVILRYFRNGDRYAEPWDVTVKTFGLGILIIVPVIILVIILNSLFPVPESSIGRSFYDGVIEAAFPEELFKFCVLYFYCVRNRHFDEPMDGLVYGVTASLGFAAFENLLYVADGGLSVAIMRAFTAVPSHALNGAIMGYFIAHYRFDKTRSGSWLLLALLVPMTFHGLWNFSLFMAAGGQGSGWLLVGPLLLGLQVYIVRRSWVHFDGLQSERAREASSVDD